MSLNGDTSRDSAAVYPDTPGSSSGDITLTHRPSLSSRSSRSSPLSFLERALSRRRSSTQSFDPIGSLGLNLLFCPSDPLLDVIFVHGLGGGSTKTWCLSADPTLFWPKAWLPREPGFKNVRIHSYGYDADWTSTKTTPTLNIHDFGRQMLEKLRNPSELANSSSCPIIFVAHSMGGLVVKQAYVLARQDPSCVDLAKRMEAMIFLATPHRGSDHARTLNRILRTSATHSTRPYISNLDRQNELLSLLNDSFRHYASDVSLYSFYESRATNLHIHSEIIVTKDSAVMGYHHERHAVLDADHRNVCKFTSPSDPNYITVREVLQSMTESISRRLSSANAQKTWRELQQIESYLAIPERPDDDLKDLEDSRIEGSCEWFAERDTFQRWMDPEPEDQSMVYWISANPAVGKSVLSGYVIDGLASLGLDCSYYFFRHGNEDKSTVSGFLRSLLYQMALRSKYVRQQLLSMIEKAVRFNKDDGKAIWRKLAMPIISCMEATTVHYWVLDALDECNGFEIILSVLASLKKNTCIRILITSRKLPEIKQQFDDLQRSLNAITVYAEEISLEDTKADIRLYLEGNRNKIHVGNESQRNNCLNHILVKSEGCFLWVRLVLDELALAWSIRDVQRILDEVPQKMDPLYSRALRIMSSRPKPSRDLAHAIITWIVCSFRPLSVTELREALKLDLDADVPELDTAIASLCAQLVHVDKAGRVMIVHLTAKTFLVNQNLDSEFHVNTKLGHLRLATICLQFLCSDNMKVPRARRSKRKQHHAQNRSPLAMYACLTFAEHLRHTTSADPGVSTKLYSFLETNVLFWVEFVAATRDLSVLTRTANSINAYLRRHIQSSSPLGEFVHLTQNWAVDLHRIVAGFGPNLLTYPSAIYCLIPPFCPRSSAIVTTAAATFKGIKVRGLKDEGWNDRLSCIDSHNKLVSSVACGDTIFAVGYSVGSIILHYNSTYLPWKTLEHGSSLRHLQFDDSSTHLLSAGRRDVKVWEVESGFVLWTFEVSHDVMHIAISEDGIFVMAADKSNTFTSWNIQSGLLERTISWGQNTPFHDEGKFRRPPLTAALSPDSSLIAIVYRGRPICLYDLDDNIPYGLVSRESNPTAQALGTNTSPFSLVFNTKQDSPLLVAAYEDGDLCLFDYEDLKLLKAIQANAHTVACSPDGLTLVTGNSGGMVQLMEFDTLQLLYQVNATSYGIRDLSFSTDNMRFLDVRGTQCNVWEPAVLSGLAKREESSTEPAAFEPIIKGIDIEELEITSIQLENSGQFFFVGRSDGSLSLHDINSGELQKVLYRHTYQISITSIVSGSQENIIATGDTAGRFIVCALLPDQDTSWKAATKLLDRRAGSAVLQLLLDPLDELLLVSTETSNSVWNVKTKQLLNTQICPASPIFSWINHPGSPAYRTLVTTATVEIYEWKSSVEIRSGTLQQVPENYVPKSAQGVKNAFTFAQDSLLAVELSELYGDRSTSEILIFNLFPLESRGRFLIPETKFCGLEKKIMHLIGGYGSRLLFLDMSRWVCSIDVSQGDSRSYVRHFPIPSDWQSQQRTLRMSVTRNGDVLFVRMNEVAIISNGLTFEEHVQVEFE